MLAGLLFAARDADDRPGTPAAALPFGATTLLEYQARLLIAAGATQIVVVVARLTPDLVGALARIARRGVAVDAVRDAGEVVAKLHPLAAVIALADGLVTTPAIVANVAHGGGDALLAMEAASAPETFERIGGGDAWAGVARLEPARMAEAAGMPRDWDLQSTLLHVAGQAGAVRVMLDPAAAAREHGIERRAAALESRGQATLAASLGTVAPWGGGWSGRWLLRPAARAFAPVIARRGWASRAVAIAGGALAAGGLAGAAVLGSTAAGAGLWLLLGLAGVVVLQLAGSLAEIRDEAPLVQGVAWAVPVVVALAAAVVGWRVDAATAGGEGRLIALAGAVTAVLAMRARVLVPERGWWADPLSLLVVLTLPAAAGAPFVGLAMAAGYAAATLASTIETARRLADPKP